LSRFSSLLGVDYRRSVLRLLARPRYAALALAAVLLAAACVRLGIWQWDRHEQRQARNSVIEVNANSASRPLDEVFAEDPTPSEWSRVSVVGRYDASSQVLLRYRPVDGQRGLHALVPLVTPDGWGVVVDRGFFATTAPAPEVGVPEPPSGTVEIVGWIRHAERGLGRDVESNTIRRVDVAALADDLPYPLYPVWIQVESEEPSTSGLRPYEPPSTSLGFNLPYAVQWWIFAAMVPVGFVLLLRAETRRSDRHRGEVDQRAGTG
jgi:cytochrome oxidase assembly protein ShyY1